jgi:glucose/mannose-6-phosphate isomerase
MDQLRKKFDRENLFEVIENLPSQFTTAFDEVDVKIESDTKKIVFSGIGGSALPANILKTYLSKTDNLTFHLKINRDYGLPNLIDKDWCGFFDSYSGNTEETLSALAEAEQRGLKQIVVLAHGGKLEEIAKEKGYLFIKIPETNQPRMAYGFVVGAMLKILSNSGLIKINFDELKQGVNNCLDEQNQIQQNAIRIAKSLENKVPIIYSSNSWKYIPMVWKINFNENSKTHSFWNAIPEMNHNEMVGYTKLNADYKVIILKDSDDHERIQKRMDTLKDVLDTETEIIEMQGATLFEKMLNTLSLGLWSSYYLALLNELDPTPVEIVEKFKKLLQA